MILPQAHLRKPCYDFSCLEMKRFIRFTGATSSTPDAATVHMLRRIMHSVGATGGVYKGQGRNQYKLMT